MRSIASRRMVQWEASVVHAGAPFETPRSAWLLRTRESSGVASLESNRLRLRFVPPPGARGAGAKLRLALGPGKGVPISDPCGVAIPHRDPIMAGAQYAVERAAGRVELVPRCGRRDRLDERIDSRIGDAGEIARTVLGGGGRREDDPQADARGGRTGKRLGHDVVIEGFRAALELGGVDDA